MKPTLKFDFWISNVDSRAHSYPCQQLPPSFQLTARYWHKNQPSEHVPTIDLGRSIPISSTIRVACSLCPLITGKTFGSSSNSCIYAIWMEFKVGFARNWSIIWYFLRLTSSLLFDDNLAWPEFATLRPSDRYYDNWNPTRTIPDFMGLDKIFLPRSLTGSISSWNV